MEWIKISLFMIFLAILELIFGFFLFLFAVKLKSVFVIFSLILLATILTLLFINRLKEKIKLEQPDKLFKKSLQRFLLILKITIIFLAFPLLVAMLIMLMKGK